MKVRKEDEAETRLFVFGLQIWRERERERRRRKESLQPTYECKCLPASGAIKCLCHPLLASIALFTFSLVKCCSINGKSLIFCFNSSSNTFKIEHPPLSCSSTKEEYDCSKRRAMSKMILKRNARLLLSDSILPFSKDMVLNVVSIRDGPNARIFPSVCVKFLLRKSLILGICCTIFFCNIACNLSESASIPVLLVRSAYAEWFEKNARSFCRVCFMFFLPLMSAWATNYYRYG